MISVQYKDVLGVHLTAWWFLYKIIKRVSVGPGTILCGFEPGSVTYQLDDLHQFPQFLCL